MLMHTITKAILNDNRGRDAERLAMKFAAIRTDPFAFFRGTAALFYRTLEPRRALLDSPAVLACGDLHLQNFGSYKGDNRLIYFDLNDFDESCVAPVAFELARFLTGVLVSGSALGIRDKTASRLMAQFIDAYAANVTHAKPRWVERPLATGPVRTLLRSLRSRRRRDLIKSRTRRKSGKIRLLIDGKRTLATSRQDRVHAEKLLAMYAHHQPTPAFFKPLDIARRIAGNGSLGLERYVALVEGNGGIDGHYLIDIKFANASALAAHIHSRQPHWQHEAERIATIQGITQAIAPALLGTAALGERSYLIKEMQPATDRVNLAALKGKSADLGSVMQTMAEVSAWGHLRGCSRYGAASIDTLASYAAHAQWRHQLMACAHRAKALVLRQWQCYAKDYDADPGKLLAAVRKK